LNCECIEFRKQINHTQLSGTQLHVRALSSEEERLRSIAELHQKAEVLEKDLLLRQREEQFRLLVEAVQDYAIFMLLSGHLKSGHAWSLQNRPCTKAIRDEIVLLCRLLRKQVCFCAPASRTAFEYVSVVKQAVEHRSDGRTVSQQLPPVFHGSVGGQ
jgi:hypothetical protein